MAHERRIEKELAKETAEEEQANPAERSEPEGRWTRSLTNFWLGILTTLLVLTAWTANLIAKPLATAFGGSVALIGMAIAFTSKIAWMPASIHRAGGNAFLVWGQGDGFLLAY